MCEQKSAGICILAAKVRWCKDDLKSLQQAALWGWGITDMGKEGFQDNIYEIENLSLSTGAHCDTQTMNTRLDELF